MANRLIRRGMAVYDCFRQGSAIGKEIAPNPHQVFWNLLIDWNTRPDSGMSKHIIIFDMRMREAFEKLEMALGKELRECLPSFLEICFPFKPWWRNTIAEQRFRRPKAAPRSVIVRVFEKIQYGLIVISPEKNQLSNFPIDAANEVP